MLFFCADGGGTKLQMLAFDENFRLLAHVKGPAVTTYYIPEEKVLQDVQHTVDTLLEALPEPTKQPIEAQQFYLTMCSGLSPEKILANRITLAGTTFIPEGFCGLLAGAAVQTGALTLAGTGSDCFFIREGQVCRAVGGYGPILGDEGSGYDLGRQTLLAAIYADENRGEPTLLRDYVFEDYGLKERMFELVHIVHSSPDTRKQVARATYTLARAARAGDAVALRILRESGRRLAQDTMALLRTEGETAESTLPVTVSGGAWKIHPLLWQSYRTHLLENYPSLQLKAPSFDPVMAGVVLRVLQQEGEMSPQRLAQLKQDFAPLVLDSYFSAEE